jgi:hypothetical protein
MMVSCSIQSPVKIDSAMPRTSWLNRGPAIARLLKTDRRYESSRLNIGCVVGTFHSF